MPSDFKGTIAGNRHYSTGTTKGSLLYMPSRVCTRSFRGPSPACFGHTRLSTRVLPEYHTRVVTRVLPEYHTRAGTRVLPEYHTRVGTRGYYQRVSTLLRTPMQLSHSRTYQIPVHDLPTRADRYIPDLYLSCTAYLYRSCCLAGAVRSAQS